MILNLSISDRSYAFGIGYIAGTGGGIVTVNGQPAIRPIYLFVFFDYQPPILVAKVFSDAYGRYLFKNLNPNYKYTAICRDLPPSDTEQRYEPYCWDYITPATDLDVHQQQALLESWKT